MWLTEPGRRGDGRRARCDYLNSKGRRVTLLLGPEKKRFSIIGGCRRSFWWCRILFYPMCIKYKANPNELEESCKNICLCQLTMSILFTNEVTIPLFI